MSLGICICSACKREVHQTGRRDGDSKRLWEHCEDRTLICDSAKPICPQTKDEIKGHWCGCDGMGQTHFL